MFGFLLIIIGIIVLLKNLGFISGNVWDIFWPALLIVVGLSLVLRRRSGGFFWEERFGWGKKERRDGEDE
jgi:hypothetical protein